ncbi:axoneme central apparatus protein [Pelomyxa schiedti]|nr:axoneme central apparatus protein [Pelomyxa schiedti]
MVSVMPPPSASRSRPSRHPPPSASASSASASRSLRVPSRPTQPQQQNVPHFQQPIGITGTNTNTASRRARVAPTPANANSIPLPPRPQQSRRVQQRVGVGAAVAPQPRAAPRPQPQPKIPTPSGTLENFLQQREVLEPNGLAVEDWVIDSREEMDSVFPYNDGKECNLPYNTGSRTLPQVFENYQKARLSFSQALVNLAECKKNTDALLKNGSLMYLRELLCDQSPSVQRNAAQALGKLANASIDSAQQVVDAGIQAHLVNCLSSPNKFVTRAAAYALGSVAKHSALLAQYVANSGSPARLCECLVCADTQTNQSAAHAIACIARHNPELSWSVVNAGAVSPLVLCVDNVNFSLKRIALSALANISKHNADLAGKVVDAAAVPFAASLISCDDPQLICQAVVFLTQIAKHTQPFAEIVADFILSSVVYLFYREGSDSTTKRYTASLLKEISKHTPQLAALVAKAGGIAALIDYLKSLTQGILIPLDEPAISPAVVALGFIGSGNGHLALEIISEGAKILEFVLAHSTSDSLKVCCVWAIWHIAKHSQKTATAVAESTSIMKTLIRTLQVTTSPELRKKCEKTLECIIHTCASSALFPLIDSPPEILVHVLQAFSEILPKDLNARKQFVATGCLTNIQRLSTDTTQIQTLVSSINSCYPPDVVGYCCPDFPKSVPLVPAPIDINGGTL